MILPPNSVIFFLDTVFVVYGVGFDNQLDCLELTTLWEIGPEEKYLELADRFRFFMEDFSQKMDSKTINIFFLIGPGAGFTDTRIIYTWLQSGKMFYPVSDYFIAKTNTDPAKISGNTLLEILKTSQTKNQKNLLYSKEPNIGKPEET
jgi:hypothetical protein